MRGRACLQRQLDVTLTLTLTLTLTPGAPVFRGNWTSPVPVPGRDSLGQRFLPRLDCDVAEVWKLSKVEARRGRLTDAMEAHALSRLAGLRNKLWLIVGASLVHAIMRAREACP